MDATANPAALKHLYSPDQVRRFARVVANHCPEFAAERFLCRCLPTLESLEMKARVDLLADALQDTVALPFPGAISRLLRALGPAQPPRGPMRRVLVDASPDALSGFSLWPITQFVARFGLLHHEESLAALAEVTRRFTAEFALRPFLLQDPARTLATLRGWVASEDQHLRRAASEGTRPRLPWGIRLQPFVRDPTAVLELITPLRDDPEEYVRRSVANSLNDIGKDHPRRLLAVAEEWWTVGGVNARRLVRHALRSRVKAGDPAALALLGFTVPAAVEVSGLRGAESLALGETLELRAVLRSTGAHPQRLALDYALLRPMARGATGRKVWKGSVTTLGPHEEREIVFRLPIRPVSTRRHQPGEHRVVLLVCGRERATHSFDLRLPVPEGATGGGGGQGAITD